VGDLSEQVINELQIEVFHLSGGVGPQLQPAQPMVRSLLKNLVLQKPLAENVERVLSKAGAAANSADAAVADASTDERRAPSKKRQKDLAG
jgi:hypothetical protein